MKAEKPHRILFEKRSSNPKTLTVSNVESALGIKYGFGWLSMATPTMVIEKTLEFVECDKRKALSELRDEIVAIFDKRDEDWSIIEREEVLKAIDSRRTA